MTFEEAVSEALSGGPMTFGELQIAVAELGHKWNQHKYEGMKAAGELKAVVKASPDAKPALVVSLN